LPAAGRRGQQRFGLPPAGVPGAVPVVECFPPLRRDAPSDRVARPDGAAAFGIPGGAGGWDDGNEWMVGERHIAFPVHPGGQVIGPGQPSARGGVVVAASASFDQVCAGTHAHRQQPPTQDHQLGAL
jgi:hypothetical protein